MTGSTIMGSHFQQCDLAVTAGEFMIGCLYIFLDYKYASVCIRMES